MKKSVCFYLLVFCSYVSPIFAKACLIPLAFPSSWIATPVQYNLTNHTTVLYLPSSCSGLINDAVAGDGLLNVFVQGKIQHGQLSVQVKVDYKGTAATTIGSIAYQVDANLSVSETKLMGPEPTDIFVKGYIKLEGKSKSSNLYIGDIGYVTVYPDGSVTNHIFDSYNNLEYSRPKVYCSYPPKS